MGTGPARAEANSAVAPAEAPAGDQPAAPAGRGPGPDALPDAVAAATRRSPPRRDEATPPRTRPIEHSRPIGPDGPTGNVLYAWDPIAKKERWRVAGAGAGPFAGGTLATAGNLVLDSVNDRLMIFKADTGEKLTGDQPSRHADGTSHQLHDRRQAVHRRDRSSGRGGADEAVVDAAQAEDREPSAPTRARQAVGLRAGRETAAARQRVELTPRTQQNRPASFRGRPLSFKTPTSKTATSCGTLPWRFPRKAPGLPSPGSPSARGSPPSASIPYPAARPTRT